MKRLLAAALVAAICGSGACTPGGGASEAAPTDQNGWTAPAVIETAHRSGQSIIMTGRAAPQARVVLRGEGGQSYGVSADETGSFELRLRSPAADTLFGAEVQVGQLASPGPERLFLPADPAAPVAVLRPGGATRRLTGAGLLAAVDSDGRVTLASGRAPSARSISLSVDGAPATDIATDADGRWSSPVTLDGGAGRIVVDGRAWIYPGPGEPVEALLVERLSNGWRVVWPLADGASQSVWLPAA